MRRKAWIAFAVVALYSWLKEPRVTFSLSIPIQQIQLVHRRSDDARLFPIKTEGFSFRGGVADFSRSPRLSPALLSGSARAELLARVPGAREMAVCGDTLFVGTRGSSVYAVPLSGGGTRRAASGFSAANGVCMLRRSFVRRLEEQHYRVRHRPWGALSGRRDIRRGLPNSGGHSLRYIAVGPDSRLYVSFGSPCNICLPRGLQGTIVSMNQDGSDLRRVAWGVRNSVGFDWRGGTMFFTDNGADGMGDDIPPDELNVLRPGGFYGFPYFGGGVRLRGFEDAAPPARQIPPVFNFQAHVATLGIHFFRSLGGDALVAEHGSWNRTFRSGVKSCGCASRAAAQFRRRLSLETSAAPWTSRKRRTAPSSYPTTREARFTSSDSDTREFLGRAG